MPAAAAGIAMAAEVSAGVRLTVDALNVDTSKTGGVTALTIDNDNQFWHVPITFSVSGEKAGATLKLTDGNGDVANTGRWNIWFKPVEAIKFDVGCWNNKLNEDQISWSATKSVIGNDGAVGNFAITLAPVEGFEFNASFTPGSGAWFKDKRAVFVANHALKDSYGDVAANEAYNEAKKAGADEATATAAANAAKTAATAALTAAGGWDDFYKGLTAAEKKTLNEAYENYIDDKYSDADAAIAQLGFMAKYTADFGTIGAMFKAEDSFKALTFGGSFAGSFDPASFFVNVLGMTGKKGGTGSDKDDMEFKTLRVEGFGKVALDPLTVKLWVPFQLNVKEKDKAKTDLGATVRLDYVIGDYTLFLETGAGDFICDKAALDYKIKPGVIVNVGECNIEAAVEAHVKENFSFSVPVAFKVSF